ncbi:Glutamate-1-semialdehyde 2,1-aminomutase, chloroplastic [Quillaja saponaria]|uniref:Glutamate-1-semialdehyde 2,1-aminomutase, chloroplastic n=1 Tax=Quillaja saponaria TaxID=32244 RepID=A0AAD7PJI4_QUISA|nr:Glutamate-1-semialdehyde 2,1-aminomutase, chloroplastic [Quillaja saponaria]
MRMAVSFDEKTKKTFTIRKSEEAFNAAKVLAALAETMKKGTSFGAPCLLEIVLAEMVISAVPSIEMVCFVNSGTEACMSVLRLARAYTGKKKIIKFEGCYHGHADPFLVKAGPMYQAGTLSGNPLAMTAGIHTLKQMKEPGTYEYLNKITGELVQGIIDAGKRAGHSICGGYIRGMFGFFSTEGPVYNFADAKKSDATKFAKFYWKMLEDGVYFAPSQFEAGFTSLAHTPEDIQSTIAAAERVFWQI